MVSWEKLQLIQFWWVADSKIVNYPLKLKSGLRNTLDIVFSIFSDIMKNEIDKDCYFCKIYSISKGYQFFICRLIPEMGLTFGFKINVKILDGFFIFKCYSL